MNIKKMLLIVPYITILSLSEIFFAEPEARKLVNVIWYSIFGRISAGDIHTFVLSVKSLGILFLFTLLFGNYISVNFDAAGVFYFTRIHSRCSWCVKKIMALSAYAAGYTGLLLLTEFLIGIKQTAGWKLDLHTVSSMAVLAGTLLLLLALLCLAVNWASIRHGISIAVLCAFAAVLLLQILAVTAFDSTWNMILNPLCFNIDVLESHQTALLKISADICYLAVISAGMIWDIRHMDIF